MDLDNLNIALRWKNFGELEAQKVQHIFLMP